MIRRRSKTHSVSRRVKSTATGALLERQSGTTSQHWSVRDVGAGWRNQDSLDRYTRSVLRKRIDGRQQFSKQRSRSVDVRERIADIQIRAGKIERESSRKQLWERSNCQTTADLKRNRRRLYAA